MIVDKISSVLTIAGSDSGGGAGIQADIKSFQERDVFGTSVITAVTAQNTLGVQGVYPLGMTAIQQQLDSIGKDFDIRALKTGMLFDADIISIVVEAIKEYKWNNVVVDPVMVSTTGSVLLEADAIEAMQTQLLPLAHIVTPNILEAEKLTNIKIENETDIVKAAEKLLSLGVGSVLIKGGHGDGDFAEDIFMDRTGSFTCFRARRIDTRNTHGTGCTYSAVVAAELGKGQSLEKALLIAKQFIQSAIQNSIPIGQGNGPTYHAAYRHYGLKEGVHYEKKFVDLFHHGVQ